MEIQLSKSSRPWKQWLLAGGLVAGVSWAAYSLTGTGANSVPLDSLAFATVEQGDLSLYAETFGEFVSARERLLTAPAQGKVAEVLVRPGAQVTPDTVILRLTNPRLEQELGEAKGVLAQQQAQRAAFQYEQQNERLNYQGRIADIEANIEEAELELEVNQELKERGVSAKIELLRAGLNVKQQRKRLEFEQKKYQQFLEMQQFQLTQRDIEIEQQEAKVALLSQQVSDMQVPAGIAGSLQTLEVELGQSVQLGQSLAKVGSDKELIARLRVPQRMADQIDINAPVTIDTQKGKVEAHIVRIETLVANGVVLAEAAIDGELPSNARPALEISASVLVKNEVNALYMPQSPGLRPRSKQSVFVRDGEQAVQRHVTFGELSQDKLVVVDGLRAGDQVISSNTQAFERHAQISLVQ